MPLLTTPNTTPGITVTLTELLALRTAGVRLSLKHFQRVNTHLAGGRSTKIRGRGIDFNEVRRYQAGDDIRNMDWRVTARSGEPYTKLYHEEKERPVYLLVDCSSNMYFATRNAFKSVVAANIAALIGWAASANHDRLGALLFSEENHLEFKPQLQQRTLLPLLKTLAEKSQAPPENYKSAALTLALSRLRTVAKPGSLIIMISDFHHLDKEAERHISRMAKHNEIVMISIYDPLEVNLPPANYYSVTEGQQILTLNTADKQLRQTYQLQFNHYQQRLQTLCNRAAIPLISVGTHEDFLTLIGRCFSGNKRGASHGK